MKIKPVGLILFSFLALSGSVSVYGEESKQGYVTIDLSLCTMEPCDMDKTIKWHEKAWVVHPRVIITLPEKYSQLEMKNRYDGFYNGKIVEYLAIDKSTQTKVYTSETELEVSKDIPPEILRVYQNMVIDFINMVIDKYNKKIMRNQKGRRIPV